LMRRANGGKAGMRNRLLASFLLSVLKIVAFHIRVGSWPVMAKLIAPFPF
jgi:hypothetical protein